MKRKKIYISREKNEDNAAASQSSFSIWLDATFAFRLFNSTEKRDDADYYYAFAQIVISSF